MRFAAIRKVIQETRGALESRLEDLNPGKCFLPNLGKFYQPLSDL